ncbi:MAG: hypothetical protein ACM37W_02710 [Actinomycetota bacterium]
MSLLYLRLIGSERTRSDFSQSRPNQLNSHTHETDLNQGRNARARQAKPTQEIRNLQQVYHLERRFLL